MKRKKKSLLAVIAVFALIATTVLSSTVDGLGTAEARSRRRSSKKSGVVTVAIDPGHGGITAGTGESATGCVYNGIQEKDMTLYVAMAMKSYLEQFDGVRVVMTRTTDTYVSLADRVKIAKNAGADFFYCIHFNASASHMLYGSEQWIPYEEPYFSKSYAMASNVRDELAALGLYQKGIKTKIGNNGDYYGILRHSVAAGIPSVLVEHSYLDNAGDSFIYSDPATYIQLLGKADAYAVAKYYGLSSKATGVSFAGYPKAAVPAGYTGWDATAPDYVAISENSFDGSTSTVTMTAVDLQSPIIFYGYSLDGGATFQPYQIWPQGAGNVTFNITAPAGTTVVGIAVDEYDHATVSAPITL